VNTAFEYQPYYCEENVWHLCQHAALAGRSSALFISNRDRCCALWNQRAAAEGSAVLWDYHVVAVSHGDGMVWDLDTRLPLPCDLASYLDGTFSDDPRLPEGLQPVFRLFDGATFVATFASDRSHMLDTRGEYLQPPPPWRAIGQGRTNTLQTFVDMEADGPGRVLTLEALRLEL
jgi:hypothetical protein